MITSLDLNFDVGTKQPGYVIGHHEGVTAGTKIPMYIPKVMSDIKLEGAGYESVPSPNELFINASECRPGLKRLIKRDNKLYAKLENNSRRKRLPDMTNAHCRDFRRVMTTVVLKDEERVTCDFFNESLRSIDFNTNEGD